MYGSPRVSAYCYSIIVDPISSSLPLNAATTYRLNVNTHYMKSGIASAAIARPYFDGQKQASKNKPAVSLWWVPLDSGSDGDILFRKKGNKTHNIPYTMRSIPQSWHTSNGIFSTKKIGDVDLVFPEYSHRKCMHITSDIL